MKKIILTALMGLCLSSVAFAQKGEFSIGGRVGFGTNGGEKTSGGVTVLTDKGSSWSIAPELQYFVADDIAVGASFDFGGTKDLKSASEGSNNNMETYDRTSSWAVAPYVAYYYKLANKFYYKPSLYVAFGGVTSINEDVDNDKIVTEEQPVSTFGIGVNILSFEYKASENIAVGLSIGSGLGYSSQYSTRTVAGTEIESSKNSFNFNANTFGTVSASVVYCF